MILILAFILTAIFIFLSLLHVYWALGGNWAIDKTIPERYLDSFLPNKNNAKFVMATFAVSAALLLLAIMVIGYVGKVNLPVSPQLLKIGLIIASVIFLIRAIGNFNDIGLFKKDSSGEFGYWDTKLYSPLCLFFSVSIVIILF